MIKPHKLKKGDKVALISLSGGLGGEELFRHRVELGKKRLEEVFGLEVVFTPNALKGHPLSTQRVCLPTSSVIPHILQMCQSVFYL